VAGPEEPTITVRGDGFARAEPDEAVLGIMLAALEPSPGDALAGVSARSAKLVELLDALGVPQSNRSTAGITVQEEFDHTEKGRHSLGHRATSRMEVRLTRVELIGRLVSDATGQLDAHVDGPRWTIASGNPARFDAARQAAAAARRRAEAYADGAGAGVGRLIRLVEPGAPEHVIRRAVAFSAGAGTMPVEPGELEVAASIYATFALETTE
jgi:uncharacterized protein